MSFFFYEKPILKVNTLNDPNNTSDFHYIKLTPLGKVRKNKPLRLIFYFTVFIGSKDQTEI